MENVVIVSATRTPVGSFNGSLASVSTIDLGKIVITEALKRAGVDGTHVDEVIMGNVLQAIAAGDAEIIVAGGMENMSRAPFLLDSKARWGYRMGNQQIIDTMVHDGLTCATNHYHMGITAENIAEKYQISRQEQDELALRSQQLAAKAVADGVFDAEIVPVTIKTRKGDIEFARDEYPRAETTAEALAKLKPAFNKEGTVTAGNSSGINDGAAAVVVMTESKAKALGLKPLARIRSYASGGVSPALMGMGPVPATQKALQKANLSLSDIDLIEANEAFAAQFLGVGRYTVYNLRINHWDWQLCVLVAVRVSQ